MYQTQQKSTENITVTVPTTTTAAQKYWKYYSKSVTVPKTAKKYWKQEKVLKKLQ